MQHDPAKLPSKLHLFACVEKGWSNNRSFLGVSACQLQAVEKAFLSISGVSLLLSVSPLLFDNLKQQKGNQLIGGNLDYFKFLIYDDFLQHPPLNRKNKEKKEKMCADCHAVTSVLYIYIYTHCFSSKTWFSLFMIIFSAPVSISPKKKVHSSKIFINLGQYVRLQGSQKPTISPSVLMYSFAISWELHFPSSSNHQDSSIIFYLISIPIFYYILILPPSFQYSVFRLFSFNDASQLTLSKRKKPSPSSLELFLPNQWNNKGLCLDFYFNLCKMAPGKEKKITKVDPEDPDDKISEENADHNGLFLFTSFPQLKTKSFYPQHKKEDLETVNSNPLSCYFCMQGFDTRPTQFGSTTHRKLQRWFRWVVEPIFSTQMGVAGLIPKMWNFISLILLGVKLQQI
ncbi:hypothetical protein VP01_168g2 [Puccinia sorghi]|uniref:Uncharacterized protein n=1 Tax=Puccinia sorghi TaxID=27349 RepID=A0A0L6VFV2_9BASI|nr:hypothetical protein VP01_168g2 [Puccinia sorghi]